ncbi:uncharacterized protein BX664DRAFT_342821 [Halteromyces radiatus]|uniref:uncharacterized protein n=1 Tax=Halteromyces radiatus TaxID=101107 RepID=UPI00221ED48C|nr:uncharacterized protein BX664DRAFT_342821 [Halteromyces radiatus]KAI8078832.1 hypothetical protein BX664DRAFT_342821 [Halteromyces radiatus]
MMMNEYNNGMTEDINYYYSSMDDTSDEIHMMQAQEANDFAQYDQMYQALYDDPSIEQDNEMMWEEEEEEELYDVDHEVGDDDMDEEEEHDDSALLRLIVGVQMYLGETSFIHDKNDTPLLDLQYKMYTYMKQRAFELGMDTSMLQ